MKKRLFSFVLAAALAAPQITAICTAAEHGGSPVVEHPGRAITSGMVKKSIKEHVKAVSQASGGVFAIRDDKLDREWRLKLDKVHDPVRQFEKDGRTVYFACSDFKSVDSEDLLDIDFWMVERDGKLEVIDSRIHKVNGDPRFTYEGTEIREVR